MAEKTAALTVSEKTSHVCSTEFSQFDACVQDQENWLETKDKQIAKQQKIIEEKTRAVEDAQKQLADLKKYEKAFPSLCVLCYVV